jgi:membrane protein implicated in regulation of membrane protease activity
MGLDGMAGLDLSNGTLTAPLWAIGIAAAFFVALIVIAVVRAGLTEFGSLVFRVAVIVIVVVFGWTYVSRTGEHDRAEERRALDQRGADLIGRSIAPGSPIACLEATNTETVEGSCERAVFASPESVAAATAYISARLSLLSDAHDYTARRDPGYETQIAGLRRTVAADRFGLASQVLATRDGCTAEACDAFGLVYDDKKLRANMKDRLFDVIVARYSVNWPTRTSRPVVSSTMPTGAPAVVTPPGPNVQFPSSQSIPPVSIMNAEPERAAPAPAAPPAQAADAQQEAAPPQPTNTAPASATKKAHAAAKKAAPPRPMPINPDPQ